MPRAAVSKKPDGPLWGIDGNLNGAWTDSAFWSRLAEFNGGYISQREPFLGVSEADRVGQYILAATATKVRGVWTRADRAAQYGTFFTWPLHAGRCDPYNGDVAMTVSNTIGAGADALVWSAQKPANIAWRAEQWISQFGYTSPIITSHNEPDGNAHWYCMYHPTNTGTVGKFSNQSIIDRPTAIARVRVALQQMWNAVQVGNRRKYIAVVTPPLSSAGAKKARSPQTCFTAYDMLTDSNGAIMLAADGVALHTYDDGFRWDTTSEADGNHSPWHYWQAIKQGQALAGLTPRHFLIVNEGGIDENIQPPGTRSQWSHASDFVSGATEEQQGPNQAALLPARRRLKCIRAGTLPFWCAYWAVSFYTIYNFCSSGDDGMNLCPARDGYVPREPTWTAYRVLCDMDRYRLYGPGPWALTIASKAWADFSTNLTKATVGYHDPLTWIVLANFSEPEKADPNQATTRIYYEWDRATFASNALTFTAPVAGQGNQLNRAGRPVILPFHGDWKVTCNVAGNTGTARLIVRGYNKYDGTEQAIASTSITSDSLAVTFRNRPHDHPAVPNLALVAIVLECTKAAVFSNVVLCRPGVDVPPPVSGFIVIFAPISGDTVSGTITLSADAAFIGSSVVGVQFQVDGVNAGSEDTSDPYSVSWDSTGAVNGQHAISATARDPSGLTVTDTITVIVSNSTSSDVAAVTEPLDGAVVAGTIPVTATASFPGGTVESVQFRRDATNLGPVKTASPYSVNWNTTTVADGAHTLSAIATKVGGGSVTSPTIAITIQNGADPPPPPPNTNLLINPFNKTSPSHRPIGSGAQYSASNHAANVDLRKAPSLYINASNDFGHRWTESYATDPLVTVSAYQNNINLPVTMRIPAGFTGGKNLTTYDKGVTIRDNSSGVVRQFFRFYRQTNTTAVSDGCYVVDLSSKGYGTPRQSSSASSICQIGLIWRGDEWNSNLTSDPPVQHALHFAVGARPTDDYMQASKEIWWPAVTRDGYASTATNNVGNIPYGGLFALPTTVDIASLGLTPRGKRLATTFRNYGIYMVDTGQNLTARGDQFLTQTAVSDITAATRILIPLLRLILNNDQTQTATGGGTPLSSNTAFDA